MLPNERPRCRSLLLDFGPLARVARLRPVARMAGSIPGRNAQKGPFFLNPLGLILQALGFGSLSLLTGPGTPGSGKSFARDPFVNLIVTGVKAAMAKDDVGAAVEHPAVGARLVWTPRTETQRRPWSI